MTVARIALLEDESFFALTTKTWLEEAGYEVEHFATGEACLAGMLTQSFNLALFDWHLPDMHGPQVMARLREAERMPPVIFLTAFDSPELMVQMLQAGADDYVTKPPLYPVLQARMQALLRRSGLYADGSDGASASCEVLHDFVVDYEAKTIALNGCEVMLTGKELPLALFLFKQRGQLLSRQCLYAEIGVTDLAVDTRRLDVHLSHLRSKLGWTADRGWRLASIYQQGYRLEMLS
ncbi:response regulator transcription factor [Limnohabitans sp.]|uniref:response regulator transcription factor n=1 Tax=Limnohabitans sp. TaxID=1907725 RepID=UPI00286F9881|nr:response regulator transcription factor [Limnohabitans sp.]